jgi:hypothetical protein
MGDVVRPILMLLLAGSLLACASAPSRPGAGLESDAGAFVAFESRAGLGLEAQDDDSLLRSQVQAGSASERVRYNAAYSLRSSALAQGLSGAVADAPPVPAELGLQSMHQALHLELPSSFGAPVSIDLHNRQDLRWSFNGEQKSESSRAHLQWKPSYLALDLSWTPPREIVIVDRPLDCHVQANVRLTSLPVPLRSDAALDLSQQDCQVLAPFRGVHGLNLQSQGLAWRWGKGLSNTVRVRRILPQWQVYGLADVDPAYEVGLVHRQSWLGWQLGLDMAWRQFDEALQGPDAMAASNWAVDLMLRRNLGVIALSARWLHGNDPLWFVPMASSVERERLSVLIDFSRWLVERLPKINANMSASWDHVEDARGAEDNQLKWNFHLTW